ncbi:aldehyde dehydrogenase (NADP(+)) [Tateyamaria sp. ANG-S1]|uniref:aldehyde dehydrogenase (NADP(+)) n=1 Tax=Tateyamaria sp. ANG-S1 TaxID=1577905 RepID=UPI00057DAA7B|nr:aldehyde dehydrogenase (NADP(+)) [Tateyamaria sp. ANG-S1]KIC49229.1 2,5-dioxovalerate dehydrogenase [Tateyamaria sp. ANG-S1]
MTFTPHGKHLVEGEWVATDATFSSEPAHGPSHTFCVGTPDLVARACTAAEAAFETYGYSNRETRAGFLNAVADEIEARGAAITQIGTQETGLPEARLEGERGRTCGQLRLFADHILRGDYLDRRHDTALPDRAPLPRPDLKMIQRPIGPVAVFGASNFPLAFSTAGGDTAAAFAAGCPVVVKGHAAHPGTGEIVAEAIHAAIQKTGMPAGTFSFIQDNGYEVGSALVQHPLIRAVGFTGSLRGGRALFDLCAARPEPIPFFGELGSINPVFCLPGAIENRAEALGQAWAASLLMGAGQFCTNPGVALVVKGQQADTFVEATVSALQDATPQTMLTDGIAEAYARGVAEIASTHGVQQLVSETSQGRQAVAALYKVTSAEWQANKTLSEEVFGPVGLVIEVEDIDEMVVLAKSFDGQLTCTLQMEDADMAHAARLLPVLECKAGRVLVNGFPTGVEVADTMVHGGPYPASTNFGATSVGTLSIRRFLRPVCYQNMPDALLPESF